MGLEELDLSQNQILKLDKSAVFKKNKNIKTLKLNNNRIVEMKMKILTALPNLEHLEIQHNRLARINGKMLKTAGNLQHFDASYNDIASISTRSFKQQYCYFAQRNLPTNGISQKTRSERERNQR